LYAKVQGVPKAEACPGHNRVTPGQSLKIIMKHENRIKHLKETYYLRKNPCFDFLKGKLNLPSAVSHDKHGHLYIAVGNQIVKVKPGTKEIELFYSIEFKGDTQVRIGCLPHCIAVLIPDRNILRLLDYSGNPLAEKTFSSMPSDFVIHHESEIVVSFNPPLRIEKIEIDENFKLLEQKPVPIDYHFENACLDLALCFDNKKDFFYILHCDTDLNSTLLQVNNQGELLEKQSFGKKRGDVVCDNKGNVFVCAGGKIFKYNSRLELEWVDSKYLMGEEKKPVIYFYREKLLAAHCKAYSDLMCFDLDNR
jgi:hypothetical protein